MGGPKPANCLAPIWDAIDPLLRNLLRWTLWAWMRRKDGRWTKPPFQLDGSLAKVDDPSTWASFVQVQAAYKAACLNYHPLFDGISFVVTGNDRICGWDFDHCLDLNLKITNQDFADIIRLLNSYTERSPSGLGLRVFTLNTLPAGGRKQGDLECYDDKHCLTVTGDIWPPGSQPKPIRDIQTEIAAIYSSIFLTNNGVQMGGSATNTTIALNDVVLLDKARNAKNGKLFSALFDRGDGKGFKSHSEADLALCALLSFWTGNDAARIDTLFRYSKLYRAKWDRAAYRQATISKAIATAGTYVPPPARKKNQAQAATSTTPATGTNVRPTIQIIKGGRPEQIDTAENVLVGDASHWQIFRHGEALVHISSWTEADQGQANKQRNFVVRRPIGTPVLRLVTPLLLDDVLGRAINFVQYNQRRRTWDAIDVPPRFSEQLIERGRWRFPELTGISGPVARSDGSILTRPGFDPESGLFLCSATNWAVPTDLNQDAACEAALRLCEVFSEFPFANPASISVVISAILSGVQRRTLSTVPAHALDGNDCGVGKTLLGDVISIIVIGDAVPAVTLDRIEEHELQKLFTAILLAGDQIVLIDNIEEPLSSASFAAILTKTLYRGRILGFSRTAMLPTNCLFLLTGNNLVFLRDLPRRVLSARIQVSEEHPDLRTAFKIPNLRQYCRDNREELVRCAFTMSAGYAKAGMPDQGLPACGGFEQWSDWIRSAIVWSGLPDPCDTRAAVNASDEERETTRDVFQRWFDVFGDAKLSVRRAIEEAQERDQVSGEWDFTHPELLEAFTQVAGVKGSDDKIDRQKFGWWLRNHRDRPITVGGETYQLKRHYVDRSGVATWQIVSTTQQKKAQP
jgi:hypothetical protein